MTAPWSTSVDQEAFQRLASTAAPRPPLQAHQKPRHSLDSSAMSQVAAAAAAARSIGHRGIAAAAIHPLASLPEAPPPAMQLGAGGATKMKKRGVRRASMNCSVSVKMNPTDARAISVALLNSNKNVTLRCEADPVFSAQTTGFLEDLLRESASLARVTRAHGPDACAEPYVHAGSDVQVWMREVVGSWMCDVSKELRFELDVHPRAMQLFDRFLLRSPLKRAHLQLMGAACMLVASKLVEYAPVTLDRLVQFSDNSLTRAQILNAELLLCSALDFDVSIVSALDFVWPMCHMLPAALLLGGAGGGAPGRQRLRRLTCELVRDQLHATDCLRFSAAEWAAGALLAVFCHQVQVPAQLQSQLPQLQTDPKQQQAATVALAASLTTLLRLEYGAVWAAQRQVEQLAFERGLGKAVLTPNAREAAADQLCYDTTPNNVRDVELI